MKRQPAGLDRFDMKLLSLIQEDATQSTAELGGLVGLSATAVQRRLRSLRAKGIIGSTITVVSPERIGLGVTAISSVSMRSESVSSLKAFKKLMLSSHEVSQCYYTAGSADFMVIASFRDIAHYERFASKHFTANKQVRRYSTHIVLETIKRSLTVPLNEHDFSN